MVTQKQVDDFRRSLSVRNLLKEHSKINTPQQIFWLTFDWVIIVGAAALAIFTNSLPVYLFSVAVIAARQHALLVIMHDAAHYRISKNTFFNDIVSDAFAAYPLLLATATYRKNHMAHHKHTNTDEDPDWVRKIHSPEWAFPMPKATIAKLMFKQLILASRDWILLSYSVTKTDGWKKPVYWAALLGAVTYLGIWKEFTLYWIVPMLTVFPLLQRIRSMSEHFGLPRTNELNSSRNTYGHIVERFFLSPHNVNYHLLHHMFPSIPQHDLKELNTKLIADEFYKNYAHTNKNFIFGETSVLSDLSGTRKEVNPIKRKTA